MQTRSWEEFSNRDVRYCGGEEGVDNNTVNNINGQFYAVNGFTGAAGPPPPSFLVDNNGLGMFMIQLKKCCLCNPALFGIKCN